MPEDIVPGPEPVEPTETGPELERPNVEALPEALGFVETPEMAEVRDQWIEAMTADNEEAQELATRYHLLAQEAVNERQGNEFTTASIGLIIRMALVRRDAGRTDHYLQDLEDASMYAWNSQMDEVVAVLDAAIEEGRGERGDDERDEAAEVAEPTSEQLATACSEVLSEEDCVELVSMSTGEAIGYAFTLLLENGIEDPEQYLRDKGILE